MALTKERIFEAADLLEAGGVKPTLEAVRKEVGGSYRTLSPAMREWRAARQTAAADVPPAVAERAAACGAQIWALALQLAEERFSGERADMQREKGELEVAREEAASLADRLTAELEAGAARCREFEQRAQAAEREQAAVQAELGTALRQAKKESQKALAALGEAQCREAEAREEAALRAGELAAREVQIRELLDRLAPDSPGEGP